MTILQALLFGAVQGLTEFLPVSSSGHLVIVQRLSGISEPSIAFDISVHVGTLLAVLLFFRHHIRRCVSAVVSGLCRMAAGNVHLTDLFSGNQDFRMAVLIVIGSIPTALLGLCLYTVSECLFSSSAIAGGMLMVTGIILMLTGVLLWATRGAEARGRDILTVSVGIALFIGLVQGLAIIPGISRSGSTIAAGLLMGLNKETAGTYSFLLSVPAIIGAVLLHLVAGGDATLAPRPMLIGTAVSFSVGILALGALMSIVRQGRLYLFAPYCLLVGLAVVIFGI